MRCSDWTRRSAGPLGCLLLSVTVAGASAGGATIVGAAEQVIYDNALQNGWAAGNSWATYALAHTVTVHSAPTAISWEPDNFEGLYLTHLAQDFADFESLRFWHHGGAGGQMVKLAIYNHVPVEIGSLILPALPAAWTEVTVTWAELGIDTNLHPAFNGIVFQGWASGNQATTYLDDIELVEVDGPPPTPLTVAVDPAPANPRPISPLIYGVNFGGAAQLATGLYTANRRGGNGTTRYNWLFDTSNRASDYFFLNINEGGANGAAIDNFSAATLAAGAEVVMTVPIDQVAKSAVQQTGSSTAKYGPQTLTECAFNPGNPNCGLNGNGICDPNVNFTDCDPGPGVARCCNPLGAPVLGAPSLRYITGYDPADTSVAVDLETHVGDMVSHLVGVHGAAGAGGVRFYNLDNEPMLWNHAHRDMRGNPASLLPATPATYDEVWAKGLAAATVVKERDPAAEILGPETWGWCDFWTSASDAASASPDPCFDGPDRQNHGGLPWPAWYMQQVCANVIEAPHPAAGQLPVDWLDIHFYPQGNDVAGEQGNQSTDNDEAGIALRLRSLKELYDPTWVSESWIGQQSLPHNTVNLIPRMRDWRDQYCPAMKLALAEYKWGRDNTLSGALAQAEALAIFGREGLDMALRWLAPQLGSLAEDAFALYRNYDGLGSRVEGDSVPAESTDVDLVASYAVRSPSHLFSILLNKDTVDHEVTVNVAGGASGNVELWRLDGNGLAAAGSIATVPTGFVLTLPSRSATLARLTFTGDVEPPTVSTITRADADPTQAALVDFTVTFSESVDGVDDTDFTLTNTGSLANTAVTAVSVGPGQTRTVTVDTGSGSGTLRLDLVDNDSIIDDAGNPVGGVGAGNGSFATGEVYAVRPVGIDLLVDGFESGDLGAWSEFSPP